MSGFSYGPSSTATTTNYDRTSSTAAATSSMYNPYNSPGAFVPHSAINLSVKSGETSNNPHSSLDLTLTDTSTAAAAASAVTNPSSYGSLGSLGSQAYDYKSSLGGSSRTQVGQSPSQILDLTRPGSLLGPTTGASGHYSPSPVSTGVIGATSTSSQSSSSKLEKQTSKIEQTEPMDFSSSQPLSSFSSRGFDASSFSRSSGPADLARFRTPASKLSNICVK